jgi:hypothetical protein
MNVPVEEDFAQKSPYALIKKDQNYEVVDERSQFSYTVRVPEEPAWYTRNTSSGVPMHRVGVLQGTYLGIYISNSCSYWFHEPAANCRFCTSGFNVGINELAQKQVEDVVETARSAKEESGATFIHFNGGFQNDKDLDIAAAYVKAVKERVGLLVGVQMVPSPNLWKYDWLIDLGANHFSFCYEFHNPEYFATYFPGKARTLGQKSFFRALEYTTNKLGKGACSGEIIAGVEPLEDTLKAIDYITDVGAFPTVCVFRPVIGSDMEDHPSPRPEDMLEVMKYMYAACLKKGIPIGLSPNIEVSLIFQPDDGRYLVPRNLSFYKNEMMLKMKRYVALRTVFRRELRPRTILGDAHDPASYKVNWQDNTRYSSLVSPASPRSDMQPHTAVRYNNR